MFKPQQFLFLTALLLTGVESREREGTSSMGKGRGEETPGEETIDPASFCRSLSEGSCEGSHPLPTICGETESCCPDSVFEDASGTSCNLVPKEETAVEDDVEETVISAVQAAESSSFVAGPSTAAAIVAASIAAFALN